MSEVTLQQYLEAFGLDLSTTKLHIIREPSASKCWEQSQTDENSDIENIAKIETACNPLGAGLPAHGSARSTRPRK